MTAMMLQQGHQPIVFDNLSKGHRQAVPNAQFVLGDFGDFNFTLEVLELPEHMRTSC